MRFTQFKVHSTRPLITHRSRMPLADDREQALRLVVKTSQNALAALLGVAYMLMHLNGSSSGGGGGGSGAVPGLQLRRWVRGRGWLLACWLAG